MEETYGEAISLSTGKGNHSGMASQAAPSPQPCHAPQLVQKTPGKDARGAAKVTAALSSTKRKETRSLWV